MLVFDKQDIKDSLSIDNIFELLQEWGGDPEYTDFGILCSTICHNDPGEGSKKLYFYTNSGLFRCYTQCGEYFDIFQLVIKIMDHRHHVEFDLNDAVRWVAQKFGMSGREDNSPTTDDLDDWRVLASYERIQDVEVKTNEIVLKEYDPTILDRFNYTYKISPWLDEGISQEVLERARIGFYPGGDQITIPHYDADGRFVGLRGRTLCQEDAERFGKYRPLRVNNQLYNHPLGMNLYNFNNAKNNIPILKKAIIFEGEKSVLKYQTYFGFENDISVACCGSSVSAYQMQLLMDAGAQEIIIAFDRQFQAIGDAEFKHLKTNLLRLHGKYNNQVAVSFIFDKTMITGYKDSSIDCGKETFLQLFKERIIL